VWIIITQLLTDCCGGQWHTLLPSTAISKIPWCSFKFCRLLNTVGLSDNRQWLYTLRTFSLWSTISTGEVCSTLARHDEKAALSCVIADNCFFLKAINCCPFSSPFSGNAHQHELNCPDFTAKYQHMYASKWQVDLNNFMWKFQATAENNFRLFQFSSILYCLLFNKLLISSQRCRLAAWTSGSWVHPLIELHLATSELWFGHEQEGTFSELLSSSSIV